MGSDRGFALTVRACRQGVIDFTQARISDVRWWRRSNLLIDSMARDDDLEIIKSAYRFHLALVANPQLTEESWKSAKTNALELFNEVVNVIHPWGAKSTEQRRAEEYDKLGELYKQHIQGDKTDEEWQEIIDAEVHRLRNETTKAETELTDEQRIDQLAAERLKRRHGSYGR